MPKKAIPSYDAVIRFRETLSPETDRGCALMAAAYLDTQIELLLRQSFIDDTQSANEMLGASKALGTFSARIDIAYLLGCIPEKVRRDLHLIRKIRNDFGHDPSPIGFSHPPIASRCSELYYSFLDKNPAPRNRFTNAVLGVLAFIHGSLKNRKRPKMKSDIEITPEYKRRCWKRYEALAAATCPKS